MKSLLVSCLALTAVLPARAATAPPNVLFILIDDLGARDLGGEGARLAESPHLDHLARQGLRFTAGYAPAPICSASRASLLTGRSPARLHFEFVTKPVGAKAPAGTRLVQPAFPVNLPLEEISLAELLSPAGYVTGFLGKWHLTQANDRYLDLRAKTAGLRRNLGGTRQPSLQLSRAQAPARPRRGGRTI
jgi:uncharacterized sulfatase